MTHRNATNTVRPPSLVDTLGTGFRALNRALPALLVPLVLDLWYWLGPRMSIHPLVDWLRRLVDPETWQLMRDRLGPELLTDRLFDLKLSGRIEGQLPFWRRMYTLETVTAAPPVAPAIWSIGNFGTLFATVLALNLVLTLLTAIYLLPLADIVRGAPVQRRWSRRILRAWLAQLGVLAIVLALLIIVGIPLVTLASVVATVAPAAGSFLSVLAMALLLWIVFTASFAYDAIVLNDAGPISALLASLLIIRRSFWGAVGLYLLNFFILAGLNIIWQGLMGSIPGLLVAMLTSAYVGAGLAAAHLVFYRDRLPTSAARTTGSQA